MWTNLSTVEHTNFINAIKAYFAKESAKLEAATSTQDYIDLTRVTLNPRQHKSVAGDYQIAGIYFTQGGVKENFALQIRFFKNRCVISDARWRDAWLSKYVPLP